MKYNPLDMKAADKLPSAPAGTFDMTCVAEGQSKSNLAIHWFLFKNEEYQVFHNCFLSQLAEFADELHVPAEFDGSVDTEKFKNKQARITMAEVQAKNGNSYLRCVAFESLDSFSAPPQPSDASMDEEIPF